MMEVVKKELKIVQSFMGATTLIDHKDVALVFAHEIK